MPFVVAAFYRFVHVSHCPALRAALLAQGRAHGIKGVIIVAPEGVNGTIAGERAGVDAFLGWLRACEGFAELEHKESMATMPPFHRLKVRQKAEIVTMGVPEVSPARRVGTYVAPEDWNALISREDVVVVDTRNDFEVQLGAFAGATNPHTRSFREFPAFAEAHLAGSGAKKVAMYCTGGIRCEKASAYLLECGFEEVYHLRGGILRYLETVPKEQSLWSGECFVFDQRVSVVHGLAEGQARLCYGCQMPLSPQQQADPRYEPGVSCPHCVDTLTPERRSALMERRRQMELAQARGEVHLGDVEVRARARKAAKRAAKQGRPRGA